MAKPTINEETLNGDLAAAQITPNKTGFVLNGSVYRIVKTLPVEISHTKTENKENLIQYGPDAPIYSVFILHDNNTWGQPNVRFHSENPGKISQKKAEEIVCAHFRGVVATKLAEDPDCIQGSETVLHL